MRLSRINWNKNSTLYYRTLWIKNGGETPYRIINNAAELLGIVERNDKGNLIHGEIGTHTLRKTFGYHSFKNGTSLELLMDIFNHSSKNQTLRYIGITEDQKKEVYLKSNLG